MNKRNATARVGGLKSFVRVIRGFAEGSLAAVGFALAILLLGTPLALFVRGLHEGLSWVAGLRGDTSPLVEAVVSVSSIAGGLVLAVVFARLLVGFFEWRRTFRARVSSGSTPTTRLDPSRDRGGSAMNAGFLRELQDRGRFFYERFPGAAAAEEWKRERARTAQEPAARTPGNRGAHSEEEALAGKRSSSLDAPPVTVGGNSPQAAPARGA
jgi:hypothetical protein